MLLRTRRGDAQAFSAVYAALRQAAGDFAGSMDNNLSPHAREDLVQEVFLHVWARRRTYQGKASAKTFILSITRYLVLKHLRRRRRAMAVPLPSLDHVSAPGLTPPDILDAREVSEAVRAAIAGLTPWQRQAVELDMDDRLSRSQAARLAGCSPSQFADRLYHARKGLRESLGEVLSRVAP
jgi:RNA polymerase sigma-70 factor (ECF subfamily)